MLIERWGLKEIRKVVVIFSLIGGLMTIPCYDAIAALGKDDRSEIIEKAKKEGEVVVYSGQSVRDFQVIAQAFEKKYPLVKPKLLRLGVTRLVARAQAEYRAGRVQADIFQNSLLGSQELFEGGLLGIYKSPEREAIPDSFKDKDGYWTCDYVVVRVLAYNTKVVPPSKVPKSYQDLLDPFWKDKIGSEETGLARTYGCMMKILGEEKGRIFFQKLSQQNINFRSGQPVISQLLAAGEYAAGLGLNYKDIEALKSAGAPIEWFTPIDQPIQTNFHVVTLATNAPHTNAAKLYIDFILSKEGQQIAARLKNLPIRTDVPSDFPSRLTRGPDGKELKFFSWDLEFVKKVNLIPTKDKEFIQLFRRPSGK